MDMEQASSGPARESERILALDALRGLGVLGILWMNIESFGRVAAEYVNPEAVHALAGSDYWMWLVSTLFFDEKFMGIFSMLFGAGIVLLTSRIEARGVKPTAIFVRRSAWLALFGLMHAYLLWAGDILFTYAICGLVAYPFRRLKPRRLLVIGIIVMAIGSGLTVMSGWSMQFWGDEAVASMEQSAWRPNPAQISSEVNAYRSGWLGQMPKRAQDALMDETFTVAFYFFWRAAGLMLVGMALYKWGVITASRSTRFYVTWFLVGAFAGVPLILFGALRDVQDHFDFRRSFFFNAQFNYWGSPLVSMAWISLVMLWCRAPAWLPRVRRLAAVGRMAFSNYIFETVIGTAIFYGHGLGLFERFDRVELGLNVIAVWAVVFFTSQIWMKNFYFGPLEWLWRSLTYWEVEPLRRRRLAKIAAV
jgi:uncharacterized protein